jgi:hypothetical protein
MSKVAARPAVSRARRARRGGSHRTPDVELNAEVDNVRLARKVSSRA